MRALAVAGLLAVLALSAHAQTFVWADQEGIPIPTKFTFALGDLDCVIRQNGSGECRRAGAKTWRFRVRVDDDGELQRIAATLVGDDLLLAIGATDEEIDWGELVRIRRGKARASWKFRFSGLGTTPVIAEGSVFVAGLGFIGRVNIDNGLPEWRMELGDPRDGYDSPELSMSGENLVVRWRDTIHDRSETESLVAKSGRCAEPASSATLGDAVQKFVWARMKGGPIDPEEFTFTVGKRDCVIRKDGHGQCRRAGAKPWPFRLPIDDGLIVRVAVAGAGDDLLLALQLSDDEGGWSRLVRIERGARRVKWSFPVAGFGFDPPLIADGSVFIADATFIGRVNVANGRPDWQMELSYPRDAYDEPELSISGENLVIRWVDTRKDRYKTECLVAKTGRCASCQ